MNQLITKHFTGNKYLRHILVHTYKGSDIDLDSNIGMRTLCGEVFNSKKNNEAFRMFGTIEEIYSINCKDCINIREIQNRLEYDSYLDGDNNLHLFSEFDVLIFNQIDSEEILMDNVFPYKNKKHNFFLDENSEQREKLMQQFFK